MSFPHAVGSTCSPAHRENWSEPTLLTKEVLKKIISKNEFQEIDVPTLPLLLYCITPRTFGLRAHNKAQPGRTPRIPISTGTLLHCSDHPISPSRSHLHRLYPSQGVRTLHSMLVPGWQGKKWQLRAFSWSPLRLNCFYYSSKAHQWTDLFVLPFIHLLFSLEYHVQNSICFLV